MVINIIRNSVMNIVEGISIIIAQKNGGTPTFEQLWASEGERRKLDIYYREAIGDLERRVAGWLSSSTAQFALDTEGNEDDYQLKLTMGQYWPTRLTGLLGNKVQDFLVHSITAGWLNDFPGVTTKEDYSAMAAADLEDIRYVLGQRDFGFSEEQRAADTDKDTEEGSSEAEERGTDADKDIVDATTTAEQRAADADKDTEEGSSEAEQRGTDADKDIVDATTTAEQRAADTDKDTEEGSGIAAARTRDSYKGTDGGDTPRGYKRKGDAVHKNRMDSAARPAAVARHRDDAPVMTRHDWTDWSGTHGDCMMMGDPFGRFETRLNSLNPAFGREVNGDPAFATGRPKCVRRWPPKPEQREQMPSENPDDRYTPNDDKRWYETLEDMSHERGPEEHRGPDGLFMEKYREQHEHEAMQQHDCGRAMMTELDR